jgi:Uma2 family endonuclease
MAQSLHLPISQPLAPPSDQRVVHYGRSWEQFKSIQKGFEQAPGVRLFYYNGTVEVLMPGRDHELFSWVIGHLIGLFLAQKGVFFQPTGAMTQEKEREVSAQADQSFCLGSVKPIPDLSIEVIYTSGGVDKLARYRALGVPEVWLWQDGVLGVYRLRSQRVSGSSGSRSRPAQTLHFDGRNRHRSCHQAVPAGNFFGPIGVCYLQLSTFLLHNFDLGGLTLGKGTHRQGDVAAIGPA